MNERSSMAGDGATGAPEQQAQGRAPRAAEAQGPGAERGDAPRQGRRSRRLAALGAPAGAEPLAPGEAAGFGPKAEVLDRLLRAGAPTPAAVAVADAFDADGASPELKRLARAAVELLETASGARFDRHAPEEARLALSLRLSPETAQNDLAAAETAIRPGAGSARFRAMDAALAALAEAWSRPRARRRREAVGASHRAALVMQAHAEGALGLLELRLHDPETGAAEPRLKLEPADPDGPPPPPLTPAADAAARAAAEAAEGALGQALELRVLLDPGPRPADPPRARVVSVRPLRAAPRAQVEIAVRLALVGRLSRQDALLAVEPQGVEALLHPSIAPGAARDPIARGVPASPGAASGLLAFCAEEVERITRAGDRAILARTETTSEDVHAIHAASGVLTFRGGLTSHAAVVARGLGKPCIVGAHGARLELDDPAADGAEDLAPPPRRLIGPGGRVFETGAWVTLDGATGEALAGAAPTRDPEPTGAFATLMAWADAERRLRVRANADTPGDTRTAERLGVDGLGLCRTEHMFFDPARITVMREMILADDEEARRAVLARLLPMQRAGFADMFRIMERIAAPGAAAAAPITIRLLDPPLHEFLPEGAAALSSLAAAMGQPVAKVAKRARALREFNPMLGKRGCRLGVAYPEIYEMQARAIFEAALDVEAERGVRHAPEIMIPLVSAVRELELLRGRIDAVAAAVAQERGRAPRYGVGIMIETPRAALRAGPLGALSAFISFGTNDLTQMTYGLSRDDAGQLMRDYVERGVFEADPFQFLDEDGVGELIRLGVERARAARPEISVGLCGEHGGSPHAIDFCERAGFDYVSCSPFRAPVARLAAAQAAIRRRRAEAG